MGRLSASWSGFGVWLLGALLLMLLWYRIVVRRCRRDTRTKIALALVSFTVTLYGVEAILAALGGRSAAADCGRLSTEVPKCIAARNAGLPFDTRQRVEVARSLETPADSVWPNWENLRGETIALAARTVHPLGGISQARTLYCNERGAYVLFVSDEFGFRNPPGLHTPPVELALIGDSFVQGYCVPDESTAAALIRREWPRTLNLGRDNHGPLSALAVLREYAARVGPATVLWFYYEGNDLKDLETEKHLEHLARYLEASYAAGLANARDSLDHQLKAIIRIKRRAVDERIQREKAERSAQGFGSAAAGFFALTRLRELVKRAVAGRRAATARDQPMDEALFRQTLALARDETRAWGGRLLFVYLPAWERFGKPNAANPHRDRVLAVARALELPVVDLTPAFSRAPDPLALFPFRLPGHYTPEGQRLIAEEILRAMHDSTAVSAGENAAKRH